MQKVKILQKVTKSGIVAVVRASDSDQARKMAEACMKGGVTALEVTFTVPGAAKVIEDLVKEYATAEVVIGAGTVLDPETARAALLAGAQFVVSPTLNTDTIKLCNRYQVPSMPGAMSIKEIVEAMEAGADIIKVFPGEILGPGFIKAVKGPLPQAPLMPTGGVSLDNVEEWIKNGCVAVGVGGNLTAGAKKGDYDLVTATAKQFIEKIQAARK